MDLQIEVLTLGRAISFSLLAPLQFFYGCWIGKFSTPYLFIFLLLSGYSFAVAYSAITKDIVILCLYSIALFFIVLTLLLKITGSSRK